MANGGSVTSSKQFLLFLVISVSFTPLVFAQEAVVSIPKEDLIYKILPILISTLAFVFSIVSLATTLIFQYLRKPIIRVAIGDRAEIFKSHNDHLVITLDTTIFNGGARYGAVYKILGVIFNEKGKEVGKIIWRMFVENKNIGEPGKQLRTFNEFTGVAGPVIIPNRQAIYKRIQFDTAAPFELSAETYTVEILAYEIQKPHKFRKAKFKFTISPDDVNKFGNTKSSGPGQPSQGSVGLTVTSEKV